MAIKKVNYTAQYGKAVMNCVAAWSRLNIKLYIDTIIC